MTPNAATIAIAAAALAVGASGQAVQIPQGAEFACSPFCTADVVGFGDGRAWMDAYNTSITAPIDANGWPMTDFFAVIFDLRPAFAWAPPTDDPWGWSAPLAGDYCFNFTGFGQVTAQGDPGETGVTISNVTTDATSTAGIITIGASSPDLLVLNFTGTRRSAATAAGTGVTALRIMVPGQCGAPAGGQAWAAPLLQLVQPYHHLRFMGITGTNNQAGYYGDAGHHYLEWTNRCLPSDAQWPSSSARAGCWGMPWEDVVGFAQASGKGIWINMPVSATCYNPVNTSSYVYQWASLLKNGNAATGGQGVPPSSPIYVEHSNEVWNFGFSQYIWNKLAAMDECNATTHAAGCLWNNDGSKDPEVWAQRRHIGKVYELSRTFAAVFGEAAVPTQRVRPVYAEWSIYPQRYNATLAWFAATYGPPAKFLYGMAATGYFGGGLTKTPNATLDDIYADYRNDTAKQAASRAELAAVAAQWGLKLVAYEAGPGWNVGTTTNLANYIIAQRMAPMKAVVLNDVTAWAAAGGGEYNHFSLAGYYSRFGQWGHAEHYFNQTTPKTCAVLEATGSPLPPACQY